MTETSTAFSANGAVFGKRAMPPRRRAVGGGRERLLVVLATALYAGVVAAGWWAMQGLVPDHLSLSVLGHTVAVREVHHRILSDAALVFAILPTALAIECLAVGWERSSLRDLLRRRTASMNTDLAVFVLGQGHLLDLLGRLMMLGASLISGLWVRNWLQSTFGVAISLPPMPIPLQVLIYFYIGTFFDYWTHRLDHSRFFWPLHRYHHSAEDFCVLTSGRQHPAAFTAILLINVPMAILGAPAEVMIYVNVLTITLGFLIHSKIDSNWGWVGRWLIQSPNHHRLHHILDITGGVGHFGMAPIWDHLFGTWRGEADQSLVIGVDTPYRHGFWVIPDMLRDYWDFWRGFFTRPSVVA